MYLSKNLKHLREKNGRQSQEKLAIDIGITRSAVSSYEDKRAEPKIEVLNKMAEYYGVSVDYLLNHDLAKLGDEEAGVKRGLGEYAAAKNIRVLAITVDKEDNENIELVPVKASAGYTVGYADKDYLRELPKYQLPFLPKGKTYRAFEISGESMLPLQPNSIVIGEYVEDWYSVKDGQICVVVSSEGIVLKSLYNKIADRGAFLLKSTNINYRPYELKVEDVLEVWKFVAYIGRKFPDETQPSVSDLKAAYFRLEDDLAELKSAVRK